MMFIMHDMCSQQLVCCRCASQMFPVHSEDALSLLSLLFFAKKLRIMHDFFQRCQDMAAALNGELSLLTQCTAIFVSTKNGTFKNLQNIPSFTQLLFESMNISYSQCYRH